LRKEHLENGNDYDLDFDNDEEIGFEVVEEVDENDMDSQRGRSGTVVSENEDVEEVHAEDDVSVHGSEDLADSYEEDKRQEDLEYQQRENEENYEMENDEEEEKEEVDHILDFHVAEAKRDPRNASYWSNPEVDLIGVFVKKSFGVHGTFRGEIKSFKRPYFKVVYSDKDEEELSLAEVLQLIDIRNLQSREGTDKEFIEEDLEDVVEDAQRVVENNDGSDSDADSKNTHYSNEEVTATILTKEECQMESKNRYSR
jgi:hypothetical protein